MGRLNVLSHLGQPFSAEIDLIAVQPAEAESLHAQLASADSYKDAQIDYPPASLGLRFELQKRGNGQYFIAVRSMQSINDPYLDFLVELKWQSGRVLREYTALLDPVGYAPNSVTAPAIVRAPPPAPIPAYMPPIAATSPVIVREEAAPAPDEVRKPRTPRATAEPSLAGDTYKVKSGDTLATIARRLKGDGVSLDQMLISLYRANQEAFIGKNINRLRNGETLIVPSAETAAAVDRKEAQKEIHAQSSDWRGYRGKLAESAGEAPVAPHNAAAGKITARVEDKSAPASNAASDRLVLSKGDDSGKLKERVHNLEEDNKTKDKALGDASDRVNQLEATNKKLEALLALKSKQAVDLESQAHAAADKAAVPPKAPVVSAIPTSTPLPTAAPTSAPVAISSQPTTMPTVAPTAMPLKPPAVKPKHRVLPPPPPPPEPGLLDNPLVVYGGGIAILAALLGGLFWAIRRSRRSGFEDSIITGSDLKSNTMVGNTGGAVISTGVTENSFLTDFSRAGLGTIDTDEVDPVAEAEVYMAYGRDAQAEEILKDALTRDSSRQEVRLKLLEIYAARKNVTAFEGVAKDLYAATQGQGTIWAQAAEMGRTLDPSNPLYHAQVPVDTEDLDKTTILSAGSLGSMIDTTKLDAPLVAIRDEPTIPGTLSALDDDIAPHAMAEIDLSSDLDFQLDTPTQPPATAEMPAVAEDSSLDFDLGFDSLSKPEAAAEHEEFGALDMAFDLPDTPAPVAMEPEVESELDMDLDFGDLSIDAPQTEEFVLTDAPVDATVEESDGMLSLDIPLEADHEPQPAPITPSEEALAIHEADMPVASVPAAVDSFDDLDVLDMNFDLGEGEAVGTAPTELTVHEAGASDLTDDLDFDFDLNDVSPTAAAQAAPDLDLSAVSLDLDMAPGDAGDGMDFGLEMDDPVTTKIDLARAYIDMGDKEGAREILQEAISEGNAEQKATAESLMSTL